MEYYKGNNMEIISKELIKPSSSTPNHLKTIKLSLLDQLSPPLYLSLIFFYEADELKGLTASTDRAEICRRLKQSLSNTLALFYPLAGKIDPDNFAIDCNDNGIEFVEARFHTRLSDLVHDPKPEGLRKYLPVDDLLGGVHGGLGAGGTIFMVQVSFFDCGGVAVGACLSHLVADGSSMVEFMNAWAATCRGHGPKPNRQFGAMARHFPARDLSDSNISPSLIMGNDKLVTRRFVFEKERIDVLKEDARSKSSVEDPTRVEVVSAFICENLMGSEARRVAHMMNIRPRASPELQSAFGNGCFLAATTLMRARSETVRELRGAIRRIDEEYVRRTREEDRYLSDLGELSEEALEEVEGFIFSSWCRFPSYEVDFGWGRPVWVCTVGLPLNNFALLMSTKIGDGIEAWITLHPDKIESLQTRLDLIGITN